MQNAPRKEPNAPVPEVCPGVANCPHIENAIDEVFRRVTVMKEGRAPNGGKPVSPRSPDHVIDDDVTHKVEEVYDWWRHIWPATRFLLPFIFGLFVAAYSAGIIQIPFARQSQVSEVISTQKAQDESIKDLKSGLSGIQGSLSKLADKIGELGADVRETKTEVRLHLSSGNGALANTSAPAAPTPMRLHRAMRRIVKPAEQPWLFGR